MMFLEVNVTTPCRPIPASGDPVSSAVNAELQLHGKFGLRDRVATGLSIKSSITYCAQIVASGFGLSNLDNKYIM